MSTDFVPKLVEDDRLILTNKLEFPVLEGAASISPQVFSANTQTGSSHTYTIQVPSLDSVVDMNILYDGDITFTITGVPAAAAYLVNLGASTGALSDCLAPFPFLQNIIVASATINQSQVSVNAQDVLTGLLPCIARENLSTWNSMTPTMLDNCASYSQAGYLNSQASVFNGYLNSNNYKDAPRGAWYIKDISGNSVGDGVASKTVTVTVHVTEPIGILSPFLFAKQGAGIQGVQAINLNLTLDATCSRSWRSTSTIQAVTCSYQNSQMLVTFLSPKASQMVKYAPRNIVPYSQLQVYKTTPVTSAAGSVSTPSVQLSSIPKMAFLYVRPVTRNYNTPDFCLPIAKINCLFNGRNGLLSGATKQQLYQMSVESGLQMNWQEFSGVANVNSVNGVPVPFFTQSGPLILTFATHLECANEYDAPSAIGAYNIQFNVNFENPSAFAGNVELYMVLVNEGLFSSERSSSSSYTSILSKSDVMGVLSDVPEPNVVTLNEPADAITGGARRYHVKAMGRSAGGRSGGKLHSRLM